jgi:hypothetical protein
MKSILFAVLVLALSPASQASPKKDLLLSYSAGFQAGWSTLEIYADGSVKHTERVCCPPHDEPQSEKSLSVRSVSELKDLISNLESDSSDVVDKKNVEMGLGYRNGELTVYDGETKLLVKQYSRKTTNRGSIYYIDSKSADKLEAWVYDLDMVQNQLQDK